MPTQTHQKKLVSIIIPAYNEEEVIELMYSRITDTIDTTPDYDFEILFVNDGSKDQTLTILKKLKSIDKRITYIDFSRNFGKEIAMTAGLDYAEGDAAIVIDADLQDPPELIPSMLEKWKEGYDDVYAQRTSRKGESILKKTTSFLYYRVLSRIASVPIQKDTGDFRLLSRKALDSLKTYRESERYGKGLFSLIGYNKIGIPYTRDPRAAGKTKWNYLQLTNLAIQGITSFTTAPLRLSFFFGIIISTLAFLYMIFVIGKTLIHGESVEGYPSLMSITLFLSGIQLISLGILSEYLGKVYKETKRRKLYFVNEYHKHG